MEPKLSVDPKTIELFDQLKLAGTKGAKNAARRALSRAVTGVRTDAVAEIKKMYTAKPKEIRSAIKIRRPKGDDLRGVAIAQHGRGIPLFAFKPRPKKPAQKTSSRKTRRPKRGVSVEVMRGRRKTIAGSFIARMSSGHVGIYRRETQKRLPIKELYGPSISQMFDRREIRKSLIKGAEIRFDNRLRHELNREFEKRGIRVNTGAAG